ncbi:MAG: acyl-CoA dehydrogenase family protein [bacterium]|nr:acyl-CoA dehydrogenase family protein [bacterium]
MAIDFTFPPDVEDIRQKVRAFMTAVVKPGEGDLSIDRHDPEGRQKLIRTILTLREKAKEWGLWLPHMPAEFGGLGLGPTAMAAVSAESARTSLGAFVLNCQAPDEGNMHTLLHFGTPEQKRKYLKPLCDGYARSCFAMTEPEVAGSDPTLIKTHAVKDGDDWVVNGHKWFISGARGANFAILIAKTDPDADPPQARNTAFIVDLPAEGWEIVRDVKTMSGSHNHCEIRIENLRVPTANILGERGGGHRLGQVRLGPARLAHCMRWIGQVEYALEQLIDRATKRFAHGSLLSEKQGIQWKISESSMELYAAKLMVLHAAYLIERGEPFATPVSMCKYHVANTLWRVVDRAIQVHGALGYSTDTPLAGMLLQARWSRFADGADEVHLMRIATNVTDAYTKHGTIGSAFGNLPI